jgi:Transcription factor Tfb2
LGRDYAGNLQNVFNRALIFYTNAQVYAYGGSALQAALLRLFVRCEAVLPGLWVGTLTRESIIGAPHPVTSHPVCSAACARLQMPLS